MLSLLTKRKSFNVRRKSRICFIRSALKPFQAIPFVSSGAASKINNASKSIALACGSHSGSKLHTREAFKILWEYDIDINNLKCPKLKTSPLEHNCSGKHAAFLATCKKLNWPIESYLKEIIHFNLKYLELFPIYRKQFLI